MTAASARPAAKAHPALQALAWLGGAVVGAALLVATWAKAIDPAAFAQQICVAETDDEAQRLYEPHVRYFFDRCLHIWPGFADAPGYRTEATIRAGLATQVAGAADVVRGDEELVRAELGRAVQVDGRAGLVGGEGDNDLYIGRQCCIDDILCPADVGLDELRGIELGRRHLFKGGGMDFWGKAVAERITDKT